MNDTDGGNLKALLPPLARSRVLSVRKTSDDAGDIVTLVLDGAGLGREECAQLEGAVRQALAMRPEFARPESVRIATVAEKAAGKAPQAPQHPSPRIIAVGSGKGGVGKSTLAANLAVALHRMGRTVGLVDADIYGPSQPRLLANEGARPEAQGKQLLPVPSPWGPAVLSMGHLVPDGQAVAWRGPMASNALGQLIEAAWGGTEWLIVDLPPGTGDIQLTMLQRFKPAGAVIISTPQDLALMDATRAIRLFETAGVPVIGLVENMAGYVCPHCGEVSDPFGHGGVEADARELGHAFLGRVPLIPAIRQESDAGHPPAAGDGLAGQAFTAIARQIAMWQDEQGQNRQEDSRTC